MENNFYTKRLPRELEYIEKHMPTYSFYNNFFDTSLNANCLELITPNENILRIVIPKNYPFKAPIRLELNGKNYRELIRNMPRRIHYLYKYPTNAYFEEKINASTSSSRECICCTGLFCPTNWTPCIMIHHMLKEIEDHNKLKQLIVYKLTLKEIFYSKQMPTDLIRNVLGFLDGDHI